MIKSNMWAEVSINNGSRGVIVDLVNKEFSGSKSGPQPKAVVYNFQN